MARKALLCPDVGEIPRGQPGLRYSCKEIDTSVVSDAAILMEDINLAKDRIKGNEGVNHKIPFDVFMSAVHTSLERLEEQNIDTRGWDRKIFDEKNDWTKDEAIAALSQLRFDVRNQVFQFDIEE